MTIFFILMALTTTALALVPLMAAPSASKANENAGPLLFGVGVMALLVAAGFWVMVGLRWAGGW